MELVLIIAIFAFVTILSLLEIPKMLKKKQDRELWAFSVLLALGTVVAVLRSLDVKIPNPSDIVLWIYSPLSEIMKNLHK